MCGRFTLSKDKDELLELAKTRQASVAAEVIESWQPRYNVAPMQRHPIVRVDDEARSMLPARWGFRRPEGTGIIVNARSETAKHLPAFRDAYANRRCIVPTDGFFEWGLTGAKTKSTPPTWFHATDAGVLLLAGLWNPGDGENPPVFTVLTTKPNSVVSKVHDRMPVVIDVRDADEWLHAGTPRLLRSAPDALLAARLVAPRANYVKHDDPACLEAASWAPLVVNA